MPLYDPNFYLGVDVEPGHFVAGLVAERTQKPICIGSGYNLYQYPLSALLLRKPGLLNRKAFTVIYLFSGQANKLVY